MHKQIGYYLVRESDKERFFISKEISPPALHRVARENLSEKHGYDYWVDYYHGLDVSSREHWTNIDQTDYFLDCI